MGKVYHTKDLLFFIVVDIDNTINCSINLMVVKISHDGHGSGDDVNC